MGQHLFQTRIHLASFSVVSLTGYRDVRVWLIEKLAHILILLFVFYFLSALIPGEAGKQFRAAMSSIIMQAIKLFFKITERGLSYGGRLILQLMGVKTEARKKK